MYNFYSEEVGHNFCRCLFNCHAPCYIHVYDIVLLLTLDQMPSSRNSKIEPQSVKGCLQRRAHALCAATRGYGGLRKPRDRIRLISSILLDSVKGNLECIH